MIIKYIIFIIFKTMLTTAFVWASISGFIIDVPESLELGWLLCVPVSVILLYDWLRSLLLPWWNDDSTSFPVFWEGGGLR